MPQPSQLDLIPGLDPTAFTSITGAQLDTLVGSATPFTDKGIVMVTTDVGGVAQVPTADVTTKWQTYLWLQISPSTTSVALYAWNPNQTNANPNFLNWQPVTLSAIPAGSIQGYQLAPATVTSDKILNISLSQVVGYTSLLTTVLNPAAGDISGSYALGFTINNGAVTLAKFDTTGAVTQVLTANGAGSAPTWQTPPQIYTGLANPNVGGSDDGKVAAVNSGAAGTFKYYTQSALATYIAPSLAANQYVTGNIAITASAFSVNAHGLGAIPTYLRVVLVCLTGELGFAATQEIPLECFQINNAGATFGVIGTAIADVANVSFQFRNSFGANILVAQLSATAGVLTAILNTRWAVKIYARL